MARLPSHCRCEIRRRRVFRTIEFTCLLAAILIGLGCMVHAAHLVASECSAPATT